MLEKINGPEDLRALDEASLKQLCAEIRQYIIECCAVNPGHLGSSLGAVELIVGLHYVYNTPQDKIVFDVGHQAYAHKILTGRREAFLRNRMKDGLSGFPKRDESIYDAFGAGHSSTSISAALGLSCAAAMQGIDEKVVALIGDGALTGGLALEGLNNAGASHSDLLIILNDNNCSIDKNIGGLHDYLLKLTTDPTYNKLKDKIWDKMGDGWLRGKMQNLVRSTKSSLVDGFGGALFESLGFRYFGPIDGNDIDAVLNALKRLRNIKGPRILHAITTKGKGYGPAEQNPTVWHAPGKFNPATGERIAGNRRADRYQDVFGNVLLDLARKDKRVVGITPAMATGCGMNLLADELPGQFFDVGIEEEHAVTFSAGLAAGGMRPFCNIYSSFSQRAYDEIIHDVALQNLPVVLCFDRAGLVGEDGATHHGVMDTVFLSGIPNMTVLCPASFAELRAMLRRALFEMTGPVAIRYPRGGEGAFTADTSAGDFAELRTGKDITLCAYGTLINNVLGAAELLHEDGIEARVVKLNRISPFRGGELSRIFGTTKRLLVAEECSGVGCIGQRIAAILAEEGHEPQRLMLCNLGRRFIEQGSVGELYRQCGLDAESLARTAKEVCQ